MAIAASYAVPFLMNRVEIARAHKASDEAKGWLEAGIAYYAANGAWPADANTLVSSGYMQASDLTNPWGGAYSLAVTGSSLQVSTAFTKYPEIGKERLPLSAVTGATVTARVTPPGTEAAHSRLLNRYGDGGNNKMFAALDMNGNSINQANALNLNRQSDGASNLGSFAYLDSASGLRISTGSSSDPITLWTNSTERARIDQNGIASAKFMDISDFNYYVAPGNSTAAAVFAGPIQINSVVTAGAACSPNGSQATDSTGKLLSCSSGVWASGGAEIPTGAVQAFNLSSCPSGWSDFTVAAGRTIIGVGSGAGLTSRNLGDTGGAETHTLTVAEMPAHTHVQNPVGYGDQFGGVAVTYAGTNNAAPSYIATTNPTGGNGAHNIMQPYIALRFCQKN